MQKCCDVQYDILPAKVYSIGVYCGRQVYCGRHPKITSFHPGKLTWKPNPNMKVWKMIFLLVWVIFRSHVDFLARLLVWFQYLDISHQHSRGIIRVPNDPLLSKTEEVYLSKKAEKKKTSSFNPDTSSRQKHGMEPEITQVKRKIIFQTLTLVGANISPS